ncbi:hypothetical protein BKA69DRAFT_687272 [Paraphysoderma sedebokerense]|nr:hypothetical protein BKA69DRAFT_687272 [Paraphysoderma sedebokerense]
MDEDSEIAVQFRASDPDDTDNLSICILSLPSSGILLVQNSTQPNVENMTVTNVPFTLPPNVSTAYFIPPKDENGMPYASLKYKANDGQLDSLSNGTINLYVRPGNDAAIFNRTSLNLIVYEDTPVILPFNISDVDEEDKSSIRMSDLRIQGDLYVFAGPDDLKDIARLLFVPRLNFYTIDSASVQRINLTYSDGKLSFSEEVSFSILPVNDPPKLRCDYPFIELPAQFVTGATAAHEIQFAVTDVDDRNFTFTLLDAPPVGFLFHGSNGGGMQPILSGESFNPSALLYSSNSSGGRYPFGNFTMSVQDINGGISNPFTYTFSFTCPPGKYNNIFKATGPICDACPEGAICRYD